MTTGRVESLVARAWEDGRSYAVGYLSCRAALLAEARAIDAVAPCDATCAHCSTDLAIVRGIAALAHCAGRA